MADPVIGLGAANYFSLDSSRFRAQSSMQRAQANVNWYFDADGDSRWVTASDSRTIWQTEYVYTSNNLKRDLGDIATKFLLPTSVNRALDSVTVAFSNTSYPTVSIHAHDHSRRLDAATQHTRINFDWSDALPNISASGVGLGQFLPTITRYISANDYFFQVPTAKKVSVTDLVLTAEAFHVDMFDERNVQKFGVDVNVKLILSASGIGRIQDVLPSFAGKWVFSSIPNFESNSAHNTWGVSAEAYVNRN